MTTSKEPPKQILTRQLNGGIILNLENRSIIVDALSALMEGDSISNVWAQMDDNPDDAQGNEDADAAEGRAVAPQKKTSKLDIARRAVAALWKRIHKLSGLSLQCAGPKSFKGHDSDDEIQSQESISTSEFSEIVSDALSASSLPRQQKVDRPDPAINIDHDLQYYKESAPKYASAMVEFDTCIESDPDNPFDSEKDTQPVVEGDAESSAVAGSQIYEDYKGKAKAKSSSGSPSLSERMWSTAKDDLWRRDLTYVSSSSFDRFQNTTARGKSPERPLPLEYKCLGSMIEQHYLAFEGRSRKRSDPLRSYLPSSLQLQTSGLRYQLLDHDDEVVDKSPPAFISAPSSSPVHEAGNRLRMSSKQIESNQGDDHEQNSPQLQDIGAGCRDKVSVRMSEVVSRISDASPSAPRLNSTHMPLLQQLRRANAAYAQMQEDAIETPLLDQSDPFFNHLVDMIGHPSVHADASKSRLQLAVSPAVPHQKAISTDWTLGKWDMTDTPLWVRADPPKYLHFHPTDENQFECTIKLENIRKISVGYKFKGNHPQGYIVDPKLGVLGPKEKAEIKVVKIKEPPGIAPNRKRKDVFVLVTLPLDGPSGRTKGTGGLDPSIFEKRKVECCCEVVLQVVKSTPEIESYQCNQLKTANREKAGTTFDNMLSKVGFALNSIPEEPSEDN